MSYLVEGKVVFHHVPKTGGNTVRKYLQHYNIDHKVIYYDYKEHRKGTDYITELLGYNQESHHVPTNFPGVPSVIFLRDPYSWYKSLYQFRSAEHPKYWRQGWHPEARAFDRCQADTFEEFITNVHDVYSEGFACNVFQEYINHTDIIGATYQLAYDLCRIWNNTLEMSPKMEDLEIIENSSTPTKVDKDVFCMVRDMDMDWYDWTMIRNNRSKFFY